MFRLLIPPRDRLNPPVVIGTDDGSTIATDSSASDPETQRALGG